MLLLVSLLQLSLIQQTRFFHLLTSKVTENYFNTTTGAGGNGSISSRLINLARETGFKKLCLTGLGPRCVMIGVLTAGQFALFDSVMSVTGAKKFHFVDPDAPAGSSH